MGEKRAWYLLVKTFLGAILTVFNSDFNGDLSNTETIELNFDLLALKIIIELFSKIL